MSGESPISVLCACGKKLKAPATAVGRKARCPACGSTVTIKASAPAMAGAAIPSAIPKKVRATVPADDDDGLGALYELAGQAESSAPPVEGPACPNCRSAMDKGAVLCMGCGYDTRTGKALSTKSETKPLKSSPQALGKRKTNAPVDLMAPQGSFMLGLMLCAVFALAASLIWIGIAWATGFTIGYIAILIGGAAGIGMRVGHKGFSTAGGMAASGMTLVAILLAKVAVIELILSRQGFGRSIFDLDGAKLGFYFLSPIGLIIIAVGMGAAYRTANGSSS